MGVAYLLFYVSFAWDLRCACTHPLNPKFSRNTRLEAERSEVKRLLDVVADRDAAAKIAAATISKLEARVEALTAELAAANSEVARLQDELDVLKGALAVSQEEGRALEHDVATLEADKAVGQAELARLQTELADVNQRLTVRPRCDCAAVL